MVEEDEQTDKPVEWNGGKEDARRKERDWKDANGGCYEREWRRSRVRAGQSCVIEFTFVQEGWNRMNIQFLNLPREHTRSICREASRSTAWFRNTTPPSN